MTIEHANDSSQVTRNDGDACAVHIDPVPIRFWWLKRLSVLSCLLLVGLVVLRLWWGYVADARLQAQLDHYRSLGQPVTVEDFNAELDAVDPDQNAALLYEKAMDAYVGTTPSGALLSDYGYFDPAAIDRDMDTVAELMALNEDALALMHEARERPDVAWSCWTNSPECGGSLTSRRVIAELLWVSAYHHHRAGDSVQTVVSLLDYFRFAEAVADNPTFISSLVGWSIEARGGRLIEEMSVAVPTADVTSSSQDIARVRAGIVRLIIELSDEKSYRRMAVRAYLGDRAYSLHVLDEIGAVSIAMLGSGSRPGNWGFAYLLDATVRPSLILDMRRHSQNATLLSDTFLLPNWAWAERELSDRNLYSSLVDIGARPLTASSAGMFSRSPNRGLFWFFQHLANRRMAVVALAIRLFVIDHGKRPETLGELVPEYLSVVPLDPLGEDGVEIRYTPHGEHALLYSVGENGVDDGGVDRDITVVSDLPKLDDVLFYLDGRPRTDEPVVQKQPPPTTTPSSPSQ